EYPTKSRATQGVISIKVSERNGLVVGAVQVAESDQIMIITDAGTLVRTRVKEVSIVGRNTQGVTLIRTSEQEHVVGLQRILDADDEDLDDTDLDATDGESSDANTTDLAQESTQDTDNQATDSDQTAE
ncbi:MAG: DNA gyrase C-terminal beta-propeller domain-containing protein, partial [Plesiomonas sp.]